MAIYGTYQCDECDKQFKGWRESDGPYPDCPNCGVEGGWAPQKPAINGVKAKAIDMAQKMAEETYGMTDMKDNLRVGDVAAKGPSPIDTAESETITRELMNASNAAPEVAPHLQAYVRDFFGASSPQGPVPTDTLGAIQGAAPAAAAARSMGADPISMLKEAGSARGGIDRLQVVGRSKG